MAYDLRVAVNKGLAELRRTVSKKSLELAALRNEMNKYQKVQRFLSGQERAARTKANDNARGRPTDWNSVLKRLPNSFAVGSVTNLTHRSSPYMHRVLAKWIKQRKVKRVERGRYQKL
ncbi:MAG TPA: hypothetical protein VFU31_22510 [Candidatus Binatia bacterium]|nr:hypothetical protein [Candidatus Binatia bacterium]